MVIRRWQTLKKFTGWLILVTQFGVDEIRFIVWRIVYPRRTYVS